MKKLIFLALLALASATAYAMRYPCEDGALYSHANSDGSVTWVWTDGSSVLVGSSPSVGAGKGC